MAQIPAYVRETGERVLVPEHFIGNKNPQLDKFVRTKPSPKLTAEEVSAQPGDEADTAAKATNRKEGRANA